MGQAVNVALEAIAAEAAKGLAAREGSTPGSNSTHTLYVLRLEHGKYYVGTTDDLAARLEAHWAGQGSTWTAKHQPLEVIKRAPGKTRIDEDAEVKRLMLQHGIANVRGGSYTQIVLPGFQREALVRELHHAKDCCLRCGSPKHYARDCLQRRTSADRCEDAVLGSEGTDTSSEVECARCGRNTHSFAACYARRHANGDLLESVWCKRCGRNGHTQQGCYARSTVDGDAL